MKNSNVRSRSQVYSVGNYLMTGKVLGKGHFARVEEATHRIIGKKVAIKIIDLTLIKEEYARRNLHREPRVMAKLRHPCIAALYETMMHGPRLYVVMEAAAGGDLCSHVLAARGPSRGLPEARARSLAAQLVSAVRHMHAMGVVHRDLKMENIMLDGTKQFIKIVDFGLSNLWSAGGALRTPCGSLEYAAPELFVDGRRYGPEVDLWSIGVIVYGMVTGGLPFTGAEGGSGRSRPQLRAAIARGFTRKQRAALACVSNECKTFVQSLLEPNVEIRMKIEEAARHRWVKRPGLRMRVHPLGALDPKLNKEIYKQISEVCGQPIVDVVAAVKAEPFGALAGMFNIKTHLAQLTSAPGAELLWAAGPPEPRPVSPPEYRVANDVPDKVPYPPQRKMVFTSNTRHNGVVAKPEGSLTNGYAAERHDRFHNNSRAAGPPTQNGSQNREDASRPRPEQRSFRAEVQKSRSQPLQSPRFTLNRPASGAAGGGGFTTSQGGGGGKKTHKYDSGDCAPELRLPLPAIHEHSHTDLHDKNKKARTPQVRKVYVEEERRLSSCPNRSGDSAYNSTYHRRAELFHRHAPDTLLTNWRTGMSTNTSARILLQSNATTIKRASLGNIVSPHSSSNSHCQSERAMPVKWCSRLSCARGGGGGPGPAGGPGGPGGTAPGARTDPLRLRRTAPMK